MEDTYYFIEETPWNTSGVYLSDGTVKGGFVGSMTIRQNISLTFVNLEKHENRKYKTYIFFLTLNKKGF